MALPAGIEDIVDPRARRWLAGGRIEPRGSREELLPRVLRALGLPPLQGGLGALRFWDQTGEPPSGWIAAADPVWLEARLNQVHLHALTQRDLPVEDVQGAFAWLQAHLGGDDTAGSFVSVGRRGYLRRSEPIATAELSAALAEGAAPEDFLPEPETARKHDRLVSEVQMCLHQAEVNRRRLAAGTPPLNALWLWGGGTAPAEATRPLPPLLADDSVLRGFWRCSRARAGPWPGTIEAAIAAAAGDFVAVAPDGDPAMLIAELRAAMAAGSLRRLVVLLRDGVIADLGRGGRFRFWRRLGRRS